MPLRTAAEKKIAETFLKKLGTRLRSASAVGNPCLCVNLKGGRCPESKRPLSQAAPVPKHDAVHLFDEVTFGILSDLIEEMAVGSKGGEWTSTVGAFADFAPLRKRYAALGQTLDAVRVWGSGAAPKRITGVDLLAIDSPILAYYRLILFDGPKYSAILLVKELPPVKSKKAKDVTCRRYLGFYSFCPYLLRSIRSRLHLVGCGLGCMLKEWEKTFSLPKITPDDLAFLTALGGKAEPAAAPVKGKKAVGKKKTVRK